MYDSWTSKGPQPEVCWTPTRRPFDDNSQMMNLQISFLFSKNFKSIDPNQNSNREKLINSF